MRRATPFRRAAVAATALALAGAGVVVGAAPAYAADFTVDDAGDAGVGTLRQAILDANASAGPDTIQFTLPPASTITLLTDLPAITGPVAIDGPGSADLTILAPATVLEFVAGSGGSSLDGVRLETSDVVGEEGISATGADLTLTDVIADGFPGFGVATDSSLTATDSSFSDNGDGGIFADHAAAGETLALTRVDVNNNTFGVYVDSTVATGSLTFDSIEAYLNDEAGIYVGAPASQIFLQHSTLRENRIGAVVELGGGNFNVINTETSDNLDQGFAAVLENASIFFNGSDTYDNGDADTLAAGGGVSAELDGSSFITYGSTFTGNAGSFGGGIYIEHMTGASEFILDETEVADNTATGPGGGVYIGQINGSLDAEHRVAVLRSRVTGNTATGDGGGMYIDDFGLGVAHDMSLEILDSTFDDNETAGAGGGFMVATLVHHIDGDAAGVIDSSTFSNNRAGTFGGGLVLAKAGDSTAPTYVAIVNSTVSGNTATAGGAMLLDGPNTPEEMIVVLAHTTVSGNSTGILAPDPDMALLVRDSIVGGNGIVDLELAADAPNFEARYSSIQRPAAANLDEVNAGVGNQVGLDPQLGPLADNGGWTLTHLPQPGSPVFDAGDPTFAGNPTVDQRGEARVLVRLDMGSVESPFLLPATGATVSPWMIGGAVMLLLAGVVALVATRRHASR